MKFLTARSRITFGLICILFSVMGLAVMLGLAPDKEAAVREGRARLVETIAMCGSDFIARGETRRLEQLLKGVVERDDDLLSAGVRRAQGTLVADIGNHAQEWNADDGETSTDTRVHVPIRAGKTKWGSVELRFRPLRNSTFGVSGEWIRLAAFVTSVCFLLFYFYLGKMLQSLDPSKAVPKRVRAALDTLAEGLLVIDRDQRIVLANQAIAAWLGRASEKLIGQRADKLPWVADDRDSQILVYPWVEAIERETPLAGVMLGLARKGEDTRVLMANASPVLGHDGKYRGVLVSFDDVTQLEEAKKGLRVAKRAAEDANRAKSNFLACMSHEIRTPMNAILGYTDVLRRGFDESLRDRQEYLDTIHASGEHLLALINDILDLSKIESGRMELDPQRASPTRLIAQVVALLRAKAEEKGISLTFEAHGLLPETILTDPVRFRQTIVNLAGNAIKFTSQGGVRIVARLDPPAGNSNAHVAIPQLGTRFVVDIIDTGIGIAAESLERIFDPFSQADQSISGRFGGTGLGLAISRKLATAMGGELTVASELGKGSVFTVSIDPGSLKGVPLVALDSESARAAQGASERKETRRFPGVRALVADDGASNRKLLQVVLRRAEMDLVLVENGQLALEAATRQPFDIILMDMQMPVMDGYAATTALRQAGFDKPILALTAHAMQGSEEQCRAAGCSGYLTKPIDIDRLLAALAEALGDAHVPLPSAPIPAAAPKLERIESRESISASVEFATTSDPSDDSPIYCSLPMDDVEFRGIAQEFMARMAEKLEAMREAAARGDARELALLAHWLKGSGGTAGFDAFTEPARELEEAARESRSESWGAGIDRLAALAARVSFDEVAPADAR